MYRACTISRVDEAIIKTIASCSLKRSKHYVSISQASLLSLLSKFYKINISRRTLNYHLYFLTKTQIIKRIRRISRNPDGTLKSQPTLYILLPKALKFLKGLIKFARKFMRMFKMHPSYIEEDQNFYRTQQKQGRPSPQRSAPSAPPPKNTGSSDSPLSEEPPWTPIPEHCKRRLKELGLL